MAGWSCTEPPVSGGGLARRSFPRFRRDRPSQGFAERFPQTANRLQQPQAATARGDRQKEPDRHIDQGHEQAEGGDQQKHQPVSASRGRQGTIGGTLQRVLEEFLHGFAHGPNRPDPTDRGHGLSPAEGFG